MAEAQILATAVELLLDAGEIKAALDLYSARLSAAFQSLPAPQLGIEIAGAFLREQSRYALESKLGPRGLAFYLGSSGLFSNLAGEPERALDFYAEGEKIDREMDDKFNLCIDLQNAGDVQVSLGRLAHAKRGFREALETARSISDDRRIRINLAFYAYSACLRGHIAAAHTQFFEANAIENRIDKYSDNLYSKRGIQWAEHLLRIGDPRKSRRLTLRNLEICREIASHKDVALCEWMLGWLDVLATDYRAAHVHLEEAKATFTAGHMIHYLAQTLITESACYLAERNLDSALASCERALDLAAPRNYRLIHADALNLRARIALDRPDPDPSAARDDAESALQLAEFCEYAWAQRDSCEILAGMPCNERRSRIANTAIEGSQLYFSGTASWSVRKRFAA